MTISITQLYDCSPTLTDNEVVEFCKRGYLILQGIVPHDINQRTIEYCDEHPTTEPSELLKEDWFLESVICHPQAAGAMRSLLGVNFHLPILMSNHRAQCPSPQGAWHVDGNYRFNHELNYLQVFYQPQETTLEMGPTELVPGSHFWWNQARFMRHYDRIRNAVPATGPAGSIFITSYQIWHRKGPSTGEGKRGIRNLLKYFYWRTTEPKRDWIIEPDFDFAAANYELTQPQGYAEQFRSCMDSSRLFYWLCGKADEYQNLGGQSWPLPARRLDVPYGMPGAVNCPKTNPRENPCA